MCFMCAPALACDYPDEGNMPLRRAVAKVRYLPETEAWAAEMHKAGTAVQYALRLDQPRRELALACDDLEEAAEVGVVVDEGHVVPPASADSTRA